MAKVAFLGLGVMGFPMAGHLVKKGGHEVTVYNRTAAKAKEWADKFGGKTAPTPKAAADGQDFVMCCVGNDNDLRSVTLGADGAFGPGTRIAALSSLDFEDLMPNVRVREDGALEMVFSSNRTTWGHGKPAFGLQDVYVSYSWWPSKGWSEPQNLGPSVNTAGVEQRATLSHDGKRLYFGRDGDIFTSSRQRRH